MVSKSAPYCCTAKKNPGNVRTAIHEIFGQQENLIAWLYCVILAANCNSIFLFSHVRSDISILFALFFFPMVTFFALSFATSDLENCSLRVVFVTLVFIAQYVMQSFFKTLVR